MGIQGFWVQDKQRQVCYFYWEEISHLWKKLYNFIPFVEEILGVEFALEPKIKEVEEKHVSDPNINEPFMADLKKSFDADRFSSEHNERLLHSHGQHSTDEVYKVLYNKLDQFADLVFYIESEEETVRLIDLAEKHNVCLIPYGGDQCNKRSSAPKRRRENGCFCRHKKNGHR